MMTSVVSDCLYLLVGGIACGLTSFMIADYSNARVKLRKRLEYAGISAFGAMAICYTAAKYFPENFDLSDAPAASIFIGMFGIGRVLRFISNRFGLPQDTEERNDE